MFLDAVVLILQEILEASLLISVLQILTSSLRRIWPAAFPIRNDWLYAALGWGFGGAVLYGWVMPFTATWFDYAGYEVINALLQAIMIGGLVLFCAMLSLDSGKVTNAKLVRACMVAVVACAIVREGSEIILYLQGIMQQPQNVTPVMLGALMAAGIGGSSGLLLYFVVCSFPAVIALRLTLLVLALFAGNMAAQATQLLTQADWLPYTAELWNSASVISEESLTGRVLYALVGYEANPSLLQVIAYVAALLLIVLSTLFKNVWLPQSPTLR